jgi:hypothetical protein
MIPGAGERRRILAVLRGPDAGLKVALAPGQRLRVGRTERADVVIRGDARLLDAHFELHHDGAACRVRDLGASAGVLVGGQRVSEAELPHGAWIRAGDTDFQLFVEGGLPRPAARADEDEDELARQVREEATAQRMRAAEALGEVSRSEQLFAVLDAARDDRILDLCRCSLDPHRSLYEGLQGEALADVAPYLVRFSPGSPLLAQLVEEGWGARWGIFLTSTYPFGEVRRRLRRFLMVEDEETGEQMYFRFYDPGVLDVFLPTLAPRQAGELWMEIDALLLEGERGALMRRDRADGYRAR